MTFPRNVGQVPIYYAHLPTGRPPDAKEKYTSKYIDAPWTPQYPFGHGLSYTTFRYDALALQRERMGVGDTQVADVTVTNTGARAGDEVVQLYLRDDVASVSRPVRMLRGFRRIHLQPGESRTLRFELQPDALAFHDADLRWRVEPGHFTVYAGGSSGATLQAGFDVESPAAGL